MHMEQGARLASEAPHVASRGLGAGRLPGEAPTNCRRRKRRRHRPRIFDFLEASEGIEPPYKDLQSSA